uniref:Methyltransferase domain-containing protein n=1 Tax=Panagrolaimus sp. ES5 TaxID=591445 RepID=A0AC34G070_9BILA
MAAVETVQRNTYKMFWDRYSDKPSNEAMLLNKNADELEELDRKDILATLPDFTDKDVVDIGAGIGRFTTIFSQTAKHVTSTDFIDSFIQKNKERNAAAKNIKYVVSDAAHLNLPAGSVDLVFTNWLMMYMSDSEVVEFVTGALKWLRPGGYLKLRESCSEPSTGRKKTATLHTNESNPTHYRFSSLYIQLLRHVQIQDSDGKWWKFDLKWSSSVPTYIYLAIVDGYMKCYGIKILGRKKTATLHTNESNPTHYRFSSLYIQLLRHVQIQDSDGKWWKFDLKWSSSVPTYIYRLSNWRQVHWLARKVPADSAETHMTFDELVEAFSVGWSNEQKSFDELLDGETSTWSNSIMGNRVSYPSTATVLSYNPRKLDPFIHVDAFEIAKTGNANIWNIDTNPYYYRTSLTKATETKDHRVRFGYNNNATEAFEYLKSNDAIFTTFVATEFMSTASEDDLKSLKSLLEPKASISLLEPIKSSPLAGSLLKRLEKVGYQIEEISNVTEDVIKSINKYAEERKLDKSLFTKSLEQEWIYISVINA